MQIGAVIKMERLRQNMKQESLAKEICSVAHLSRVENGYSNPSQKILDNLSQRLGVPLVRRTEQSKSSHQINMDELFYRCTTIINTRDRKGAMQLIDQLSVLEKTKDLDAQAKIDLNLLKLRMFLVRKGNTKVFLNKMEKIKEALSSLTQLQKFRVYMISGVARYGSGNLSYCLKEFSKATEYASQVPLCSFERADFSYVKSVAFMANAQSFEALDEAKNALQYFKSELASHRVVECLLICGTAYKQLGQSERSLTKSHEAERICKQFHMKSFSGIVFQNLGDAYSTKGRTEVAIDYFKDAQSHKENPSEKIYSVLSLLKEYTKLDRPEEMSYWLREGYRILPMLEKNKKALFEKHFNVYRAYHSNDDIQIENVLEEAFKYFQRESNQKQIKVYGKMLADFYTEMGHYKKSVYYYEKITE